ncbi:hypothetical protein A9Q99_24985 [Gammaproteobacteria bacterium 45_16_T64]|nr:hypothetical protein A9Q99_24985 [Gammaproteobacteria bacterium 45_16_T64]
MIKVVKKPAADRAMEAAVVCFCSNGINNSSMEDIALEAGMARSTLYRYFKDKDELIIAVMEREAWAMAKELSTKITVKKSFAEFIIEGMLLALIYVPEHPVLGKMFAPDSLATSSRIVLMKNHLSQVGITVIGPAIKAAKLAKLIPAELTAELLMDWLIRVLFSLLTMPSDITETNDQKRKLLEAMLLPALTRK